MAKQIESKGLGPCPHLGQGRFQVGYCQHGQDWAKQLLLHQRIVAGFDRYQGGFDAPAAGIAAPPSQHLAAAAGSRQQGLQSLELGFIDDGAHVLAGEGIAAVEALPFGSDSCN